MADDTSIYSQDTAGSPGTLIEQGSVISDNSGGDSLKKLADYIKLLNQSKDVKDLLRGMGSGAPSMEDIQKQIGSYKPDFGGGLKSMILAGLLGSLGGRRAAARATTGAMQNWQTAEAQRKQDLNTNLALQMERAKEANATQKEVLSALISHGLTAVGKTPTEQRMVTPMPMTDKNWTVGTVNGITVARKMGPDGRVITQPYDPKVHGQANKPGANASAGVVDNPQPGLTGDAAMQNYTPQVQTLAKKLVKGEIPYPSAFALRDPLWKTVIQAATDLDPSFNAQTYKMRQDTQKSFTSGPDAKNVTSINTLVGHLDSLQRSADNLGNWTGVPVLDKFINPVREGFGNTSITRFNMDLGAVESELANVFKQTGATDQEIKAWRSRINDAQSPEQLRTVIKEAVDLMGSRLMALRTKYETGMGQFGSLQILSPKSRAIVEKMVGKDTVDALEPAKQESAAPQSGKGGRVAPKGVKARLKDGTIVTSDGRGGWN